MNETNSFAVLVIGFHQYEEKLLRSILSLTKGRARTYRLATDGGGPADMLLVNGDSPAALRVWRDRRSEIGEEPCLVVCSNGPPRTEVPYIRRPLIFMRVVAALDQIATMTLKSAPDLVIGQDTDAPRGLEATLGDVSDPTAGKLQERALVVDDSISVLKLMEIELRISAITGDFAQTGEQAWKLLAQKTYDIVFLDVVLPDIDGYHICKVIKKNKSMKHIPVIMLTGRSSPFDRVRGKLAGCDHYLVKPVPHEALQNVFRRFLPAKHKQPERRARVAAASGVATW